MYYPPLSIFAHYNNACTSIFKWLSHLHMLFYCNLLNKHKIEMHHQPISNSASCFCVDISWGNRKYFIFTTQQWAILALIGLSKCKVKTKICLRNILDSLGKNKISVGHIMHSVILLQHQENPFNFISTFPCQCRCKYTKAVRFLLHICLHVGVTGMLNTLSRPAVVWYQLQRKQNLM